MFSRSFTGFLSVKSLSLLVGLLMGTFIATAQTTPAYYYLIAGSFDNFQAASQLVTSLEGKGQTPVMLFPNAETKYYRVSVYSSLERAKVSAFKKGLKGAGQKYWILEQKPAGTSNASANKRTDRSTLAATEAAAEEGMTYHLILGSFDDAETANRSVDALTAQGYEPYVLYPQTTREKYRVSVFRSNERAEIDAYSSLLKKKGKTSGWILEETAGTTSIYGQPGTIATDLPLSPGTRTVSPGNITYHLIAGSFDRFDQASAFAEKLRTKGINTLIMFPETGISQTFRVSVYQSTQRERVSIYQKDLKQRGQSTWVYEQK